MATQVTNYQCPACMGPLHFKGESGRLECDYCGSSFNTAEIEALYGEKEANAAEATQNAAEAEQAIADGSDWDTSGLSEDWGADAGSIKAYCCPSCGAELLCDATTAATSCPYCGNPSVIPGQFSGVLKPDFVLPFKLSKEDAIKALKKHYLKKPLLPSTFSKANHLEEIKGVYVPFWLYDCSADYTGSYKATRIHTWSDSQYNYTKTDHFLLRRGAEANFQGIPMDGSSKMDDTFMESIEPYDYGQLIDFDMAYLTGFLADKYDVPSENGEARIRQRVDNAVEDELQSSLIGYATVIPTSRQLQIRHSKARYALLPVWILNTQYRGKIYTFAMNGQTGKMTGSFPICPKRTAGWFAGICAGVTLLSLLVQWLIL